MYISLSVFPFLVSNDAKRVLKDLVPISPKNYKAARIAFLKTFLEPFSPCVLLPFPTVFGKDMYSMEILFRLPIT